MVMTKKLPHNESAPIRWLRDRYRRHLHAAVCAILRDQHRGCPAGTSVCVWGGGWGRVAHTIRGGTLQALVVGAGAHTNRQRQRQALRLMTMHPSGWDHPACPGVHQRTWLGSPRVSHTPQTAS